MAANNRAARSKITADVIAHRREHVARLRARSLSFREIASAMAAMNPPVVNPETGEAWSYVTVKDDVDALKEAWRENALEDIGDHIARQFAEIQEAKRKCWLAGDLTNLAKFVALEMKLLGTEAPTKFDDWTSKDWERYARDHGLSTADVIAEAEAIVAANTRGADASGDSGAVGRD